MRIVDAVGEKTNRKHRDGCSFPNSIFAREEAFQLRSSTMPVSYVFVSPFRVLYNYVCSFVALLKTTFVENSHCFVLSMLKSVHS